LTLTRAGGKHLVAVVQEGDASLAKVIDATLSVDECALLSQACSLLDKLGDALSPAVSAAESDAMLRQESLS
jgi:hypothetical protein